MSSQVAKQGKLLSALERLDGIENRLGIIEKDLITLQDFINGDKQNRETRFAALVELMEGITDVVGRETIDAVLATKRAKKEAERIAAADKQVEDLVAKGTFIPQEVVTEKSLVVGSETDKATGKVLSPGKFYVEYRAFLEDVKPRLLGAKIGDTVEGANGNTILILGAYETAVPKTEPTAPVKDGETEEV